MPLPTPKIKLSLKKIISGGQTGADRAGLFAAKELGLETGGWMTADYKCQDGNHPEFKEQFGVSTVFSYQYPVRTALNVKESDGTVRFAEYWNSPGELLTLKMITQYQKPHIDIYPYFGRIDQDRQMLRMWITDNKIQNLNVAGNSERTAPGIYDFVYNFLIQALKGYV